MFNEESGMEYGPYDHAEEMRACLAYLNKLYTEGLLDNQYLTRDDDSINALISNNQAGYFYAWADDAPRLIEGGHTGCELLLCVSYLGARRLSRLERQYSCVDALLYQREFRSIG